MLLGPDAWEPWLDMTVEPTVLEGLLVPFPAAQMEAYPVSAAVNSVKHNGPDLITPAT